MRYILVALLLTISTTWANLQIVPVSASTQKQLGLEFALKFTTVAPEVVEVQLTAEKSGKLKDLAWPSVFQGSTAKTVLDVPLKAQPVLTNQYSFHIHPNQLPTTRLHLHCLTGGSAEVRYEIDLGSYGSGRLISTHDFLPALTGFAIDPLKKEKLDKLKTGKIATIDAARNAAMQYKGEHGLDARDGAEVVSLFSIAGDIEGFANNGNFIWNVKIVRSFLPGVSDELWINADTGKGLAMVAGRKPILEPKPSQKN